MIVNFAADNLRVVAGKAGITLRSDEPIEIVDADADEPTAAETTSDGQYTVRLSKRQSEAFSRLASVDNGSALIAAWAAGSLTLPNAVKGPGVKRGIGLSDFLSNVNAPASAENQEPNMDEAVEDTAESAADGDGAKTPRK